MKKLTIILTFALLFIQVAYSQSVSINDDGASPNGNTILDINSTIAVKGMLIPRVTTAERTGAFDDAFGANEEGLTVYDTDTHSFYFWNSVASAWSELTKQGSNWSITGNSGINPATNFLGTTDAQDLVFRTNNIERARYLSTGELGINTTAPDIYLHIYGDDATTGNDDATYSDGTGLLVLGNLNERNLVIDQNEILARNNGDTSSLYLQNRGGDLRIHYDKDNINHDDGIVIIKNEGEVGIGTLTPEDMLHIYSNLPYIRFTDTEGGNSWNEGVYGNVGFQRFQITEYTGAATYRQRFVIKEGGNTGIGTVSPEGLLHIKADDTNNATFIIDADAGDDATDTWKIQSAASDNNLNFINDVNTNVIFKPNGYVGIGADPQKVFHISNSVPYIRLEDTDGGNYWELGNTSGDFRVFEDANARFEIEAGGNVGIGTDNPDAKLHVLYSGTVMGQYPGTVAAFQQNNAVGDWSRISIIAGNTGASLIDFGDADKQDPGSIKYDHTDNYMAFLTNNTDERVRITSSGNVGIMVTDPDEVLEVNGAIHIGTTANNNTGTIRWNGSNFQGYDGSTWKPLDVQTTTGGGWTDGGTNVYLTTTSDNVGIGTTTPNEKLEVNGSIRMTDGNQAAGSVMVSDANGTASWSNESDGVKTRVIRQINGGDVNTVVWNHPENIEVSFNPGTEIVTVENKSTDAINYWNVTVVGGATAYNSIQATNYKAKYIRDDGTNDLITFDLGSNNMGWFDIICSDQNNEEDGFIIHIVYYGDDLNGTVQYWDN